ncbi:hypothetical protein L6452_04358 [Arctium lappa]|uniref:Uncharacterized protein n=1 Tax=Arctium lappa TaxID=4217 RepID=A0ACB9FQR9_ARCLA|nr:hypothetical protein L6452_04358 [Arctium lappa]
MVSYKSWEEGENSSEGEEEDSAIPSEWSDEGVEEEDWHVEESLFEDNLGRTENLSSKKEGGVEVDGKDCLEKDTPEPNQRSSVVEVQQEVRGGDQQSLINYASTGGIVEEVTSSHGVPWKAGHEGDSHKVGGGLDKPDGSLNIVGLKEKEDKVTYDPISELISPNLVKEVSMDQNKVNKIINPETELTKKDKSDSDRSLMAGKSKKEFENNLSKEKKENADDESRKGSASVCVEKGRGKREFGENSKNKKGEGGGLGRGKMNFHMIKQMARASVQKNGKAASKASDRAKLVRTKKMSRSGGEGDSQNSISNGVQSSEFSESLEEFGAKLGVSWEAVKKGGGRVKVYDVVWGFNAATLSSGKYVGVFGVQVLRVSRGGSDSGKNDFDVAGRSVLFLLSWPCVDSLRLLILTGYCWLCWANAL